MPEPVPQRAAQQQHGQGCEVVGGHDPLQFPAARPEPRRNAGSATLIIVVFMNSRTMPNDRATSPYHPLLMLVTRIC